MDAHACWWRPLRLDVGQSYINTTHLDKSRPAAEIGPWRWISWRDVRILKLQHVSHSRTINSTRLKDNKTNKTIFSEDPKSMHSRASVNLRGEPSRRLCEGSDESQSL